MASGEKCVARLTEDTQFCTGCNSPVAHNDGRADSDTDDNEKPKSVAPKTKWLNIIKMGLAGLFGVFGYLYLFRNDIVLINFNPPAGVNSLIIMVCTIGVLLLATKSTLGQTATVVHDKPKNTVMLAARVVGFIHIFTLIDFVISVVIYKRAYSTLGGLVYGVFLSVIIIISLLVSKLSKKIKQKENYSLCKNSSIFTSNKKVRVFLLCTFLGNFGAHRFYTGKIVSGIILFLLVWLGRIDGWGAKNVLLASILDSGFLGDLGDLVFRISWYIYTLGWLGSIWIYVDIVMIATDKFTDKNGCPLGKMGFVSKNGVGEKPPPDTPPFSNSQATLDISALGLSREIQTLIEFAMAGGNLGAKEIAFIRQKAREIGENPDLAEMAAKARLAEEQRPKTVTVTIKPRKPPLACFMHAIENSFMFTGRACRADFWQFVLVAQFLAFGIFMALSYVSMESLKYIIYFITRFAWLSVLGSFLPMVSLWIRRIHDTGKSGWFLLVPVYNIFLLFKPGTMGQNKFGDDPIKPVTKEVLASNKEANAAFEKVTSITEKLQIVGGTLFGLGSIGSQLYDRKFITFETIETTTKWVWIFGLGLLAVSRSMAMLRRRNTNTRRKGENENERI